MSDTRTKIQKRMDLAQLQLAVELIRIVHGSDHPTVKAATAKIEEELRELNKPEPKAPSQIN